MTATREIYFNIAVTWPLYALAALSLGVFGHGLWRRLRLWRRGQPLVRTDAPLARLRALWRQAPGHQRLLARFRGAGLLHLGLFAAFVLLFIGTLVCWLHEDFGLPLMQGAFYLYFQSLTLDLAGGVMIAVLAAFLWQRVVRRPPRLGTLAPRALAMPLLLLVIACTGFFIEGARIRLTDDPWAAWSPLGNGAGALLAALFPPAALAVVHRVLWWFHLVLVLGLIAAIPYSKLLHVFTAPASVYLQKRLARGTLRPRALDGTAPVGAGTMADFSWKDLLDLDACTECGRCQESCPAVLSGKPLNPKSLVLSLRATLTDAATDAAAAANARIAPAEIWSCTTCGACMEACPVFVEHVDKVVDLRRHAVQAESRFPAEYAPVFRNLERFGDPLGKGALLREDWTAGLPVARVRDGEPVDTLFWAGCMASLYDERSKGALAAAVRVLARAGVKVGVLGGEELCCGDPARRMGNEYLYQQFAQRNVEILQRYGIKRVVTQCPHCFNTLKNEYPAFGGEFEVLHMVELTARLLQDGTLTAKAPLGESFTYHDPCYLGRHNGVYDAPRAVIGEVLGGELREMPRSREQSLCCGAGGGNVWCGTAIGERIEEIRINEAMATGAGGVLAACPFCAIMLDSAAKQSSGARAFRVMDVIELVDLGT